MTANTHNFEQASKIQDARDQKVKDKYNEEFLKEMREVTNEKSVLYEQINGVALDPYQKVKCKYCNKELKWKDIVNHTHTYHPKKPALWEVVHDLPRQEDSVQ